MNPLSDIPTPRTDKVAFTMKEVPVQVGANGVAFMQAEVVPSWRSRELECELITVRAQTDTLAESLGKAISALESARPTPPDTYRMNWKEIEQAEASHAKECDEYLALTDELGAILAAYRATQPES